MDNSHPDDSFVRLEPVVFRLTRHDLACSGYGTYETLAFLMANIRFATALSVSR